MNLGVEDRIVEDLHCIYEPNITSIPLFFHLSSLH
jgi:hypothetical protein